jgi:hypothetical protein
MTKLNFGQAFQRVGISTLGGRGTKWCELNANGILVLMAHKNYFRKFVSPIPHLKYIDPGTTEPSTSPSVMNSLNQIGEYFQPSKPIILLEAIFKTDGGPNFPAMFDHATGRAFNATMIEYDRSTGRLVCNIGNVFQI